MGRKNRRELERHHALLLGDDFKFTRDPVLATKRQEARTARANAASKRASIINQDWTTCVVPGCRSQTLKRLNNGIEVAICSMHAAAIWEHVERDLDDPDMADLKTAMRARRDAIRAEREEALGAEKREYQVDVRAGRIKGEIYYVQVADLVKVGWTQNLEQRMRHYGPNSVLLVHYPAWRSDETALHRQLAPSRAKGREWYHDDPIIRDMVKRAIHEHGTPTLRVLWTEHTPQVATKRVAHRR